MTLNITNNFKDSWCISWYYHFLVCCKASVKLLLLLILSSNHNRVQPCSNKELFLGWGGTPNQPRQQHPTLQQKNPLTNPYFVNAWLPRWWEENGDGAFQGAGTKWGKQSSQSLRLVLCSLWCNAFQTDQGKEQSERLQITSPLMRKSKEQIT